MHYSGRCWLNCFPFPHPPDEPPAKLLDDLFLKTKAAPCIYWLPLTEEQVGASPLTTSPVSSCMLHTHSLYS